MLPLLPEEVIDGSPRRMAEDAIVLALQGLKLPALGGATGGYVQTIKPWQGDPEPTPEDRELNRITNGRFPAVLITTGSAEYTEPTMSRDVVTYELEVRVLLVVDNARSQEAKARDGVDADPGVYQLMEDVYGKLWGAELNIVGIGRLTPSSESVVVRVGSKAVWAMDFLVMIDLESTVDDDLSEYSEIYQATNNADDDTADPIAEALITL